jgi:hypothetical protein
MRYVCNTVRMIQPSIPNLVPQDEAEQILAPFLPEFENCILEGLTLCRSLGESNPRLYRASSTGARSFLMNDSVCDLILEKFKGRSDVLFIRKHRTLYMLIQNRILIRFKRFYSRRFRTRNIMTAFQVKLMRQESLPELEAPASTRITVGWLMDKLGWEIRDMGVACPNGDENAWTFSFVGSVAVAETVRLEVPRPAERSMPTITPKKVVREKRAESEK